MPGTGGMPFPGGIPPPGGPGPGGGGGPPGLGRLFLLSPTIQLELGFMLEEVALDDFWSTPFTILLGFGGVGRCGCPWLIEPGTLGGTGIVILLGLARTCGGIVLEIPLLLNIPL